MIRALATCMAALLTLGIAFPQESLPESRAEEEFKPAAFKVRGVGLLRGRALKRQLNTIFDVERRYFSAADIEDAALILLSSMQADGYLEAVAKADIYLADGSEMSAEWDKTYSYYLPRDVQAKEVVFRIQEGPRFYYRELELKGDFQLSEGEAEEFFYAGGLLLQGPKARVFTPGSMNASAGQLESYLRQLGYRNARVSAEVVGDDRSIGAMDVAVTIDQGRIHRIESLDIQGDIIGAQDAIDRSQYVGQPYSRFRVQDLQKALRNAYFREGYANYESRSSTRVLRETPEEVAMAVEIEMRPGAPKRLGEIEFDGLELTKESMARSKLRIQEGDPLNPIAVENSRLALSRFGIFNRVDFDLRPAGDDVSDLFVRVNERDPWTVDLLAGWGSYERLRGGVVAERINVFGRAHRLRLKAFASMKSLSGDWSYLIPDLWKTDTTFSTGIFYLERDEVAFERQEFGFDIGFSRYMRTLGVDADLVYTIESLEELDSELGSGTTLSGPTESGGLELRLSRDRRDNPLSPSQGYRYFGRFGWSTPSLGGDVDYQIGEIGYSAHGEFSRGLLWHAGLTHGAVGSFSERQAQVPNNKLFFLGGENTVRGYQRSGAAPRNEEGRVVGARSYLLANLELEQRLTEQLSVVLFYDWLGQSVSIDDYPIDESLSSVGLGLRLKTFIGPIRLEYGHNLDQRAEDPQGTLHFAIGYPF